MTLLHCSLVKVLNTVHVFVCRVHRKRQSEGSEGKKPTKRSKMGGAKKPSRSFKPGLKKGASKTGKRKPIKK